MQILQKFIENIWVPSWKLSTISCLGFQEYLSVHPNIPLLILHKIKFKNLGE